MWPFAIKRLDTHEEKLQGSHVKFESGCQSLDWDLNLEPRTHESQILALKHNIQLNGNVHIT